MAFDLVLSFLESVSTILESGSSAFSSTLETYQAFSLQTRGRLSV